MLPTKVIENNTLQGNRERTAFTQAEVGSLLGLFDDAIGNYENGRRSPGLNIALGIELLYGRTLAELYPALAHHLAEQIIPALQKLSVQVQWEEGARAEDMRAAIAAIGDRLIHFAPLA
jgi:transcriptional regulator with XRE-family HTH domain